MRIAMLSDNDAVHDSRIRREAFALADAGHDVRVFCIRNSLTGDEVPDEETVQGVLFVRRGMPRTKDIFFSRRHKSPPLPMTRANANPALESSVDRHSPGPIKKIIGDILVFKGIERAFARDICAFEPDVLHAHDLATLPAGARLAADKRVRLVYDAHELEWDRNADYARPVVAWRRFLERRYATRADAVITVSPSIARFLVDRYAIDEPTLVLNAPSAAVTCRQSATVRDACPWPSGAPLGVYVGARMPNRGLEQAIDALARLDGVALACVGSGAPEYDAALKTRAEENSLGERFFLVDPVDSDAVARFISPADFSLVLVQDTCLSYRYAFPNKLLESTFAGLPILASSLSDISVFVREFGCGLVVDQTSPAAIATGVEQVLARPGDFRIAAERREAFTNEYAWDAQRQKLIDLYDGLSHCATGSHHALA